jgi:predicted esterase
MTGRQRPPTPSRRGAGIVSLLLLAICAAGAQPTVPPDGLVALFETWWSASSPGELDRAADRLVRSGASFDAVYHRLRAGRAYKADVARGEIRWQALVSGGARLPATIVVPPDYDPSQQYAVRVYLHGGIMRPLPEDGSARAPRRRLESDGPYFYVHPTGFAQAPWWSAAQVDNVAGLVERLKHAYNVDENRMHLAGVSDGGTGVYFFGMRDAGRWSALLPFNGHLRVLANPATGADGDLFLTNLVNTPAYAINGGRDPLYPVSAVEPYMALLRRAGAPLLFKPQMSAAHDTSWWTEERAGVDEFLEKRPRDPLPDRLTWATDRTDRYNRFRWLVIDRLDGSRTESPLEDHNVLQRPQQIDFGLRVDSRVDSGRRIVGIVPGSMAKEAGLRPNDLLLAMDGTPIDTAADIGRAFAAHVERSPLVFLVERGGRRAELQIDFPPPFEASEERAFERRRAWGRVDLERAGNTVEVQTRGVGRFTLLLSPADFDFTRPVRVVVNGIQVFEDIVRPDVATLLRWAARDRDRTMLFGAELAIEVPARPTGRPDPRAARAPSGTAAR